MSGVHGFGFVVLGMLLGTSTCGGSPPMTTTHNASTIASNEDARAAVGKVVMIRGTVQREKLGDTINVGDLSVRCEDLRFPDTVVGNIATAEGTLEIVHDEPATISARGEISQGTEGGVSSFVIRHCVVR
jgi:hypothetical protein